MLGRWVLLEQLVLLEKEAGRPLLVETEEGGPQKEEVERAQGTQGPQPVSLAKLEHFLRAVSKFQPRF